MRYYLVLAGLLAVLAVLGQSRRTEVFDTSGIPRPPTTLVEQQILEMIVTHKPGDFADAARIHRKLGRYYADQGDRKRAEACFLAEVDAQRAAEDRAGTPAPVQSPEEAVEKPPRTVPASGSKLTGSYFGYDGRTLHTWDFRADGTFLHTWMASGTRTSVRNSERGAYRLTGDVMELKIASTAGGFVTPGIGDRSVVVGGGSEASGEVRRLKCEVSDNSVVLDGVKLKPKTW